MKALLAMLENNQDQKVHQKAIVMIQKNVSDYVPYLLLALICAKHHNFSKSFQLFDQALSLCDSSAYCLVHYAKTLSLTSNHERAVSLLSRVDRLAIQDHTLADTVGVVYSRAGSHEEAVNWFLLAVSLSSSQANYYYNLGSSQKFLGKFDDAKLSFEKAFALSPSHYKALSSIVSLNKQTESDNKIIQLKDAFNTLSNDSDAKLHLGHALAKSYEDLGKYNISFEWLQKAKQDKLEAKSQINYHALFKSIKAASSFAKVQPKKAAHNESPIFIVGLPRTGTTLVDQIISSHNDVCAAGELNVFASLIKRASKSQSRYVLDEETLNMMKVADYADIGHQYIQATQHLRGDSARFTDKMPLNFFYADMILRALPNAKIIALRRHPMDSCLSNYRQLLTSQQFYYDYTFDLNKIGEFYLLFDDLIRHWKTILPSSNFMEVQYEDIVFNQEAKTRELLAFCNLDWDEQCLKFQDNTNAVSTASSVQVRQPLYSSSIGRWQRYDGVLNELQATLEQNLGTFDI